jgi:hypothetical protein
VTPPAPKFTGVQTRFSITKLDAAQAQLDSAIWIWFTNDDPISVHTLAIAAHDCYHALGAHAGKPSFIATFMKAQSIGFQKRAKLAQNFFKHGGKRLKGSVPLDTLTTDATLVDCCFCHKDLGLRITPLIQLFWFRALVEQPELLAVYEAGPFQEQIATQKLNRMSRQEFLDKFLPIVEAFLADKANKSAFGT